jgi:hypothetical protein
MWEVLYAQIVLVLRPAVARRLLRVLRLHEAVVSDSQPRSFVDQTSFTVLSEVQESFVAIGIAGSMNGDG